MYDPQHGDLAVVVWHDGGPSDERLAQWREFPDWSVAREGRWYFVGTDVTAPRHAVMVKRRVGLLSFDDVADLEDVDPAGVSVARDDLLAIVQRPAGVL